MENWYRTSNEPTRPMAALDPDEINGIGDALANKVEFSPSDHSGWINIDAQLIDVFVPAKVSSEFFPEDPVGIAEFNYGIGGVYEPIELVFSFQDVTEWNGKGVIATYGIRSDSYEIPTHIPREPEDVEER